MAKQTTQSQSSTPEYFNLHTSGIGYLNRVRWVHSNKGGRKAEPFLACSISALRGAADDVAYTSFDLRVSGEEAIGIVSGLEEAVKNRSKVIVSFRIGDIYPHMYERDVLDPKTRRPTGQKELASLIKGRLILINSVKVDGELVYKRPADEEQEHDDTPQPEQEAAPPAPAQRSEAPRQQRVQQRPADAVGLSSFVQQRPQGQQQGYRQREHA